MSIIKRWAKTYYNLSPIFQEDLFGRAGNEELVAINSRLLAAYCIRMRKEGTYTKQQVNSIFIKYCKEGSHWINFARALLLLPEGGKSSPQQDLREDQGSLDRQKFNKLLAKLFNQNITQQQFTHLCSQLEIMIPQGLVTQLDFYTLDLSFNSIHQIAEVASINLEASLHSISSQSLQFIEAQMKRQINPHSFQLIRIFNRIKETAILSAELSNLSKMLEGNIKVTELKQISSGDGACMKKQVFGFMLWLLHVNQLGQFVYKFAKQNYLFSRYYQNNLQIACNILYAFDVTPDLSFQQLIILCEIIHRLQELQQGKQFFREVKQNIVIQLKLKSLKQRISLQLSNVRIRDNSWISSLNRFEIDFKSTNAINALKKIFTKLGEQKHFSIILEKKQYIDLLALCIKINEIELYRKLKAKINKKIDKDIPTNGLLQNLQKIYLNEPFLPNMKIYSIYELKRIKNLLSKLPSNTQQTKRFFKSDSDLLFLFREKLNKNSRQLQKHPIDSCFQIMFVDFKL